MATFTEADVQVVIRVYRDGSLVRVEFDGKSYDVDGRMVRTMSRDITDRMSSARLTGAGALLNDVEQYVRNLWEIPE